MEPSVQPVPVPPPVVPTPNPVSVSSISSGEKASFLFRFAAFNVDNIIVGLVIGIPLGSLAFFVPTLKDYMNLVSTIAAILYFWLFTGLTGATPGKKFFKLSVITKEGAQPSLGTAFLRETIGKLVSSIPLSLGYLWALWDKDKQAWHDKIASTYVIQTSPVSGIKRVLAYLFALFVPVIAVIGIIAAIIIIMINPKAQIEKANQLRLEQDRLNQVREQQLEEMDGYLNPTPTPYLP